MKYHEWMARQPRYAKRIVHGKDMKLLAAVFSAYQDGRPTPTYRDLMAVTGFKSPNAVALKLRRLREMGLVDFQDGLARTLVPTCRFIPADELKPPGGA